MDAFQKHMDDVDGAMINAAGLTFHSVSLHDVIKAMPFPVIEVHISNLATRDEIHRHSILTPAVRGAVMGLGWRSYTAALRALTEIVREEKASETVETVETLTKESTVKPRARTRSVLTVAASAAALALMLGGFASGQGSQATPGGQAASVEQTPGGGRAGGAPGGGRQGRGGRGAQPRVRKALLAWADTRNGQAQHAFTSHALAVIERLGYDSGLWDTFIRTDSHIVFNQAQKTDGTPASGGPSLSNVDGIFFLGHREVPITDQQKAELLAFVRSGKGFVAAHTGLTAFESWPEFGEMLGATYGGHLYTGPGV